MQNQAVRVKGGVPETLDQQGGILKDTRVHAEDQALFDTQDGQGGVNIPRVRLILLHFHSTVLCLDERVEQDQEGGEVHMT